MKFVAAILFASLIFGTTFVYIDTKDRLDDLALKIDGLESSLALIASARDSTAETQPAEEPERVRIREPFSETGVSSSSALENSARDDSRVSRSIDNLSESVDNLVTTVGGIESRLSDVERRVHGVDSEVDSLMVYRDDLEAQREEQARDERFRSEWKDLSPEDRQLRAEEEKESYVRRIDRNIQTYEWLMEQTLDDNQKERVREMMEKQYDVRYEYLIGALDRGEEISYQDARKYAFEQMNREVATVLNFEQMKAWEEWLFMDDQAQRQRYQQRQQAADGNQMNPRGGG
ncbi:MAG: hypothetical protein NUW37_11855 [Planctomycetes bacterium]|nr:hypothetical protein [Planctomycetota bacterium]